MPLGFYPRDVIGAPLPVPGPEPVPTSETTAPEAEHASGGDTPVTGDLPATTARPRRAQPSSSRSPEPNLPMGVEELPPHDEKYQGRIIQPSAPRPAPAAPHAATTEDAG